MHLEVLTDLQKTILTHLRSVPDVGSFYLSGGTALSAFYLGHRRSNDLDIFTATQELILPFSWKLEEALRERGLGLERKRQFQSFVELSAVHGSESTIVHIALDSPFRFEPPVDSTEFPGLRIDGLVDIATNKLLALFGRAFLRDFIDVFFLAREKFLKDELAQKAKLKDPGFDLYWLGVALGRIDEFSADSAEMLLLIRECRIEKLRNFFNTWRREISALFEGSPDRP